MARMETPNEARDRVWDSTECPWDPELVPVTGCLWCLFVLMVDINNKLGILVERTAESEPKVN